MLNSIVDIYFTPFVIEPMIFIVGFSS